MSNQERGNGFSRRQALVQIGAGVGLTAASEGLLEAQEQRRHPRMRPRSLRRR